MYNVVVSGYYGSKNAGDEAMLAAMIEVLTDVNPQVNIMVISASPDDTARRHGVKAISWLDVSSIWRALRRADLLISGGGSLLQNVTSGRSLYYYLSVIALARFLGTPVMLYAQGIGPVCGSLARAFMRRQANGAALITVRDKGSLEELRDLRVTKPVMEVTADPVLAIHPVETAIGRKILQDHQVGGVRSIVGISVREWRGWTAYKQVVARAADDIVRNYNAQVVFLPMQVPEDVVTSKEIARLMEEESVVLTEEYTTNELLSLVGCMDLLISIRLHALIFAGVMGIPMIGLSYDPKIERFLASINEKPAGDLANLTHEELNEAIAYSWKNREEIIKKNNELVTGLRVLAIRNAEEAVRLMEKGKNNF